MLTESRTSCTGKNRRIMPQDWELPSGGIHDEEKSPRGEKKPKTGKTMHARYADPFVKGGGVRARVEHSVASSWKKRKKDSSPGMGEREKVQKNCV